MQTVRQIKVGKHNTGIVGLDNVLKEMAETMQSASDEQIAAELIQRISKKNYIPSGAYKEYETAFIREYRKFIGEPVAEEPLEQIEIKVLGAGCPSCDKLERTLMTLIGEMGVAADLEHVRDMKEIAGYGVMGSPALVINRKVKAVGSVPSKSTLKDLILQATSEFKQSQGV